MTKQNQKEYSIFHKEIRRKFGIPDTCEHCKKINLSAWKIHWSNKSGKYSLDRKDWQHLCPSCHMKYDNKKFPDKYKLKMAKSFLSKYGLMWLKNSRPDLYDLISK